MSPKTGTTPHIESCCAVRVSFTRDEMAEDLVIVPARVGEHEDSSEYQEILPTSPP